MHALAHSAWMVARNHVNSSVNAAASLVRMLARKCPLNYLCACRSESAAYQSTHPDGLRWRPRCLSPGVPAGRLMYFFFSANPQEETCVCPCTDILACLFLACVWGGLSEWEGTRCGPTNALATGVDLGHRRLRTVEAHCRRECFRRARSRCLDLAKVPQGILLM